MSDQPYTASKSRSDRPGWSVTFRHPVRSDSRGQRGLKVRRGLGTSVDAEADRLVTQVNQLLGDESWWSGDRRQDAERNFDPIVVSAFFDGIEAGVIDSEARRNSIIAMPGKEDGYSKVLFLGTTGAGKTTLLRHVIGSDPIEDRFPSTSTARTTTADIEIITSNGPYSAVVTFMPEHEVRAHIDECLEDACLEAAQGRPDAKVVNALLQHREQKFRLSYILGSWTEAASSEEGEFTFDDEEPSDPELDDAEVVSSEARALNVARLRKYLVRIREIVGDAVSQMSTKLGSLAEQ